MTKSTPCIAVVRPSSNGQSSQLRLSPPQFMSGPLVVEVDVSVVEVVPVGLLEAEGWLIVMFWGGPSLPTPGHWPPSMVPEVEPSYFLSLVTIVYVQFPLPTGFDPLAVYVPLPELPFAKLRVPEWVWGFGPVMPL
ncbi:MAG TPA: hypothetical protein VFI84_04160 [Candidatus Saccharimonadales bacterium]|nr:hypothetical protein [Candidatus Saccharimonadales bacterium]